MTAERTPDPVEPTADQLPEAVRTRVVALVSRALAKMPDDEVPLALRRIARWTPKQRERLAVRELCSAVASDALFRQRVGAAVAESAPDLVAALDASPGVVPEDTDAAEAAAVAYLSRPTGWEATLAAALTALDDAAARTTSAAAEEAAARLEAQLEQARSALREEQHRRKAEVEAAKAETAELARELRETKGAARRAEKAAAAAQEELEQVRAEAALAEKRAQGELRKLRQRVATAESTAEAGRKARREERNLDDVRARLLLDTITEAASGLSRELALPPVDIRPADLVAGHQGTAELGDRAQAATDPRLLERLLELRGTHLVVDGYNVSKTGWEKLPLEQQRTRLVSGLATLAARTGVEVTCCFDGAASTTRVPLSAPKSVRVRFSAPGTIADDLIREIVAAEPQGRPLVVVSSDREVARSVRQMGARAVESVALLGILDRG
jgi:predicted RNA-binding protein with PIN domain